ncbi:MAG: TonB-dependent receptor plug domain-containing protein, partial [Candidatus Omnitrophica bacterium]|nr:TonB-dependent receptor plug domain-containing protein [Candidatus Omnitrophota bacterium]
MKQRIGFLLITVFLIPSICFAIDDFDLGEINILASRNSLNILDVTQGVSVVTREDIEQSTATSVPEIIGTQSGIFVANYLGNPKGVNMDIRGFGETSKTNVLVLIDGRRTNQVDLSGADWGQISLDSIERIEILKGASTVLYGDN